MTDGPFPWHRDHEAVHYDASGSGYDLGVDEKENPLINYKGHTKTIDPDLITDILPEEYQPDDPTRSPEDVAETWVRCSYGSDEVYGPFEGLDGNPERPQRFVLRPAYNPDGSLRVGSNHSKGFGARDAEIVKPADVPFSEVPADD